MVGKGKGGHSAAKSDGEPTVESQPISVNRRWLLRGGVIVTALLVALVAWLATGDDGSDSSTGLAEDGPRIVTAAELSDAATTLSQPLYWAGEVPDSELELTELPEGGARVRYLAAGTAAGDDSTEVLTVGSYPVADPGSALEGFAGRPDAIVRHSRDGREVVSSEERPTSVYFVDPENSVQVEVYDPSPERAMRLALSGRVQPAP